MLTFLFTKTPLLFFTQSFWRDEAFTVILAKQPLLSLLITTAKDFNPPLYYILVHFWMYLFGSSEISLRTISLVFYWLTIYICYLFLTNIYKFNVKKSLIYLLLFIFNPILIYYACEARMYTMLAFFATGSFYFFLKKEKKWNILLTILGLYTHYFMIFVVAVQFFMLFFQENKKMISKKNFFIAIPLILSVPWFIFVLLQKGLSAGSFWIENATVKTIVSLPAILYTGYIYTNKYYDKIIGITALALWFIIALGFVLYWKRHGQQKYIYLINLFWGFILPLFLVLISFIKPVFLPRYIIFSTVGLLLLIIFIIDRLHIFFRGAILILLIIISINYQKLEIKYHKKSNYRKIMTEIKYLAKPEDVMYVTSELDYFTAQYYFAGYNSAPGLISSTKYSIVPGDENRVYIYGKTYEEIPDYVGKVLISKSRIVNSLPLYPKKAFILTSDSHYEIQSSL